MNDTAGDFGVARIQITFQEDRPQIHEVYYSRVNIIAGSQQGINTEFGNEQFGIHKGGFQGVIPILIPVYRAGKITPSERPGVKRVLTWHSVAS